MSGRELVSTIAARHGIGPGPKQIGRVAEVCGAHPVAVRKVARLLEVKPMRAVEWLHRARIGVTLHADGRIDALLESSSIR